jgi:hypothetical protein
MGCVSAVHQEGQKVLLSIRNEALSHSGRCPLTSQLEKPNLHMLGARRQGIYNTTPCRAPFLSLTGACTDGPASVSTSAQATWELH